MAKVLKRSVLIAALGQLSEGHSPQKLLGPDGASENRQIAVCADDAVATIVNLWK
jgi:hypothetical protein